MQRAGSAVTVYVHITNSIHIPYVQCTCVHTASEASAQDTEIDVCKGNGEILYAKDTMRSYII